MAQAAKKTNKTEKKTKMKKSASLLHSLPESIENLGVVKQVAGIIDQMQDVAADVKEEASKELQKVLKRCETSYKTLEKKVHRVSAEAKKQAQVSIMHLMQKWHESKEKLPKGLTTEIEKLVGHLSKKKEKPKVQKKASTRKKTKASTNIEKEDI
jgi:phage-related minor tail protein